KPWPKLNPYTGRVFLHMHYEDAASRLTKSEMRKVWNDKDFIEHCRKQILWYSSTLPDYKFPDARRGKLCFPKR
ncbi:MAG: hypothetical protein ACRCWR_13140, partial [Saezia sp.]